MSLKSPKTVARPQTRSVSNKLKSAKKARRTKTADASSTFRMSGAFLSAAMVVIVAVSIGLSGMAHATSQAPASLAPPHGFTTSQLLFNDTFSGTHLNTAKWNTYIASKGSGGWPWNASTANAATGSGMGSNGNDLSWFMPGQVHVNNGLTLTSKLGSTKSGYGWTSGIISTYGKFQMNGGYLQVRMKTSGASGVWPAIWMLPGSGAPTSTDNYEIDVQEGGFTDGTVSPVDVMASHEHNPKAVCSDLFNTHLNLSSGYHTYGLNWVPGKSETFYVDGKVTGTFTSAHCSIAAEPMEVIIDLGMAGSRTTGWHTVVNHATPSTNALQVSGVQVYKLAN